jgi:hypothetical protein
VEALATGLDGRRSHRPAVSEDDPLDDILDSILVK